MRIFATSIPVAALLLLPLSGWGQTLEARETPPAEVADVADLFVAELSEGREIQADDARIFSLSPFRPERATEEFAGALAELVDAVAESRTELSGPWALGRGLATGMLVLRAESSPLAISVQPLCLVETEDGAWRVAPGLRHFDHVHLGFDPERVRLAVRMSRSARKEASDKQAAMRAEAAADVLSKALEERATWPVGEGPQERVKRFLRYSSEGHLLAKLAACDWDEDLAPSSLESLLEHVSIPLARAHDVADHPEVGFSNPLFLESREFGNERVEMLGVVNGADPSDMLVAPVFLRQGPSGWLVVPYRVEEPGIPPPALELMEWSVDEETRLLKEIPRRFAEAAVKVASPEEAHRQFVEALCRRDYAKLFGLAVMPDADAVHDDDDWMANLSSWTNAFAPTGSFPAMVIPLESGEEDDLAYSFVGVFQPAQPEGLIVNSVMLIREAEGQWLVIPDFRSGRAAASHRFDALQLERFERVRKTLREREEAVSKRAPETLLSRLGNFEDDSQHTDYEEVVNIFGVAAETGDHAGMLRWVGKPLGDEDPATAVSELARWLRDVQESALKGVIATRAVGSWVGVLYPVRQAERQVEEAPLRLVFLRQSGDAWSFVPGLEYFREINRGYRRINERTDAWISGEFDDSDLAVLKELREWLRQYGEGVDDDVSRLSSSSETETDGPRNPADKP